MKPLLHTVRRGGSGRGLSYYTGVILCPKRRALDDEAESQGLPGSGETPETLRGTAYHAYHELGDKVGSREKVDTAAVEMVDSNGDPYEFPEASRIVAENLFRAYRARFTSVTLGKLISAEEIIDLTALDVPWKPNGIRLTMAADRIERIGIEQSTALRLQRGISVPPGIYGRDYKTDGTSPSMPGNADKYLYDVKGMLYQLGWNATHPKQQLNGMLYDVAYFKSKEPQFSMYLQKPPTEIEEAVVHSLLTLASHLLAIDPPPANPLACHSYNRTCPYLLSGRCQRSTR